MRSTLFLASMFALAHILPAAIEGPVHLDSGLVSGVAGSNADVRVFRGIPYAAAPVGNLRWRDPQPARTLGRGAEGRSVRSDCTQPAFRGAGPSGETAQHERGLPLPERLDRGRHRPATGGP